LPRPGPTRRPDHGPGRDPAGGRPHRRPPWHPTPETAATVAAAAQALASAGARVEEATPPSDGHALTLEV
jgi:Asp-tRNA(Asn)/Glu-tRNA(Gln) amidotransferase A subunit family amidase